MRAILRGAVFVAALGTALPAGAAERVLAIGGAVTEIVYALGAGDLVVARDTTSSFPPEVENLPDVGYMRALSAEGVMSVAPDLILAVEGAGPPETLAVLRSADIPLVTVPEGYDGAAIAEKISVIGTALGREAEAEALIKRVMADLEAVTERTDSTAGEKRKSVLFILAVQGGRVLASGRDTAADAVIALAGARNALTEFEGYKPLTDEAILVAAPDVILMMDRGGDATQYAADLLAMPAIAATPAAKSGALVQMGGLYLLGFGPRTADAVADLSDRLYGG
ncbi:MAG: ABC transporter substrate-binding protein [Rhodobacteraceae bacterium]|nr:ABC transporter substrate-binding protein [Paracoccaceae bacterium]